MSSLFYSKQTYILPLATIRRERMLPWQGEVLVKTGQQVEPSDVVGRAGRPRDPLILDVTQKLQVSTAEADRLFLKAAGESVRQGEVLAERKGGLFGKRRIASPVDGRVLETRAGRMIIQPSPELFELRALLSGSVASVSPGYGVTLETPGALIQGVWGSGKESYGVLKIGVSDPAESLRGDHVEIGFHGSILVCGATLDVELLEKARELQVRGLVVGGVPAELLEHVRSQLLPVVATEGVGRVPMSKPIFNLLQANEGRETMMLATSVARWKAARPELIIPLPASARPELPPAPGIAPARGHRVRIRRAPYQGMVGTIRTLHTTPKSVENGSRHSGADVTLQDGTVVFVPFVNLDYIGN